MYAIVKIFMAAIVLVCCFACKSEQVESPLSLTIYTGETMGTYYNIRFVDEVDVEQSEIDSVLVALNQELSTYIPTSTISKFNSSHVEQAEFTHAESPHFMKVFKRAYKLASLTSGKFDPSIAPVVSFWGFGYDKEAFAQKDTSKLDSLREIVSLAKWRYEYIPETSLTILVKPKYATLDFSAIAKGYGVDLVSEFLESKGIHNYFVDIGGEARALGSKGPNNKWTIGINVPLATSKVTDAVAYFNIDSFAVATSGNYRIFYEEDGQKFGHIIDPFTCRPVKTNLLSATVVHKECMNADAIATALMITGLEVSKNVLKVRKDYSGLLIYLDDEGELQIWKSDDFPSLLE